jgi:hypothetical protein
VRGTGSGNSEPGAGPASVKFDSRPNGMMKRGIGYSESGSTTLD